jgi:hypothetical protein
MYFKKNLCVIAMLIFIASCNENTKNTQPVSTPEEQKANESPAGIPEASAVIFKNDTTKDAANGGFGYDIYVNGKLFIHQPAIPAIQGTKGFNSFSDAEKVSGFVIQKIKAGDSFPSISTQELDSLGIK